MASRLSLYAHAVRNQVGRILGAPAKVAYVPKQRWAAAAMYAVLRTRYDATTSAVCLGCCDGETSFLVLARGDHGEACGAYQWHLTRRNIILAHTGIDVWAAPADDQARAFMAEISEPWNACACREVRGLSTTRARHRSAHANGGLLAIAIWQSSMTYLASPRHYAPINFVRFVNGLNWTKGWVPKFPTLHNTAAPSLKQYLAYGATAKERWGSNLNHYYQGKGWHSGVHLVCCPDYIWNLCDLEQDGISVSCWNHLTIGIEMIGDFATEDFTTGPGAKVRDNAVAALAALCNKFGWHPDPLVIGSKGLHFHHMCAADHHDCPGKHVDRADIVKRVLAEMARQKTPPLLKPAPSSISVA